ncbi:IS66 family insertion sequence element accessory protein TnpA [sulfur-oxidizing endosymbiont of Gigantopelta aegis]|uniref:IS66 family insertion sequence element accessory protein TnpA n=1 Tax=sulfur-oxidizing endosymbiont of Gigantopelta aegis TaxID=2794934 RepID=UPI0018DB2026|nr:hypothetical protein [sulfur-oxidizing endosymbiont of Gigantopelta aegis]
MSNHSKDASMKQHIEACQASNLSQAVYCQQHKIPSHIFSYYRKKLGMLAHQNRSTPTINSFPLIYWPIPPQAMQLK